jgi:hypothetical protein
MAEPLFTRRGEMPRSIRVRATDNRTALPIKDVPAIVKGEVILARDDWFTPKEPLTLQGSGTVILSFNYVFN